MRWMVCLWVCIVAAPWASAADAPVAADLALERLRKADCPGVLEPLNKGLQARESKAFFVLGAMYLKGACVDIDVPRGLQQLERAAKAGEALAAEQLVLVHGLGRGVPQDYARAGVWAVALVDISELKRAAGSGTSDDDSMIGKPVPPGDVLDAAWTKAFGQAATIQALASEKILSVGVVAYSDVTVKVRATVSSAGPRTPPTVTFADEAAGERVSQSSVLARPAQDRMQIRRDVRELFEGVARDVPALESSVSVSAARTFVFDIR